MKTKYYIYTLIFAISIVLGACSKSFLDVEQKGSQLEENFYQNADDAFEGLVAIYDQIGGTSNGYINKFTASLAAVDDHYAGGGGPTDQVNIQAWSDYSLDPAVGPHIDLWARGFSGVFRANVLISKLPDIPMEDDLRKRYMAESKFLRAYFYFDLVRWFENIPLFENPISGNEIYEVTQAPPADVFNLIIEDLTIAIDGLPVAVPVASQDGRATVAAAKALLAKVYLNRGDYAMAAQLFQDVNGEPGGTSQYGNKLLSNFDDLWVFENKGNSESIFSVKATSKKNWDDWGCIACAEGNWLNTMSGPRNYNRLDTTAPDYFSGWSFFVVTPELESVMNGDPRYNKSIVNLQLLEDEGKVEYEKGFMNTGFFLGKFLPLQSDASTGGVDFGNFEQDMYDIRLADTYLLEAEALIMGGINQGRAQALLDAVRNRVGLASVPVTMDAIKFERRMELVGEGHRWFDLIRWGDAADALAFKGFVKGKHEVLPIPLLELDNTLLEQNTEYGGGI